MKRVSNVSKRTLYISSSLTIGPEEFRDIEDIDLIPEVLNSIMNYSRLGLVYMYDISAQVEQKEEPIVEEIVVEEAPIVEEEIVEEPVVEEVKKTRTKKSTKKVQ